MFCPNCGGKSKVIETRADQDAVYRRRRCLECRYVFHTEEIDSDSARVELNRFRYEARLKNK